MASSDRTIWKVLLECLAGLFVGLVLVLLVFGAIPALAIWIASKSMYVFYTFLAIIILLVVKLYDK